MARFTISKSAAQKAIKYSEEAATELSAGVRVMDNNVNSNFAGLQDPTVKKYLELSGQMQDMIKQVSGKMNAISEYCQSVIRWIDNYTDI